MDIASGIMTTAERATATPRTTIGDLQGMHNNAISELEEVAHTVASKIDPIRVRREMNQPTLAGAEKFGGETSPVGLEIITQTSRVQDITRYLRTVLNEIEF